MPQSIRTSTSAGAVVFAPLDGSGRAELVERRLTDAIVLGLLADGERLPSESDMAKRLGVATVTAREALESLRLKGLVETRRGRDGGSFVTAGRDRTRAVLDARVGSLSRVELRDMGAYYSAIAGSCAELAADRATDDDLERVRGIALVTDDDETAARRRQGMFQLEIAALSQSARLVREELRLQAEFAPLLWLWLREPEYRRRSLDARGAVLDAIAGGDAAGARDRTASHVAGAIDWLLETKAELEERA
ncbi:MAG: FadR family transcriptional regulator [Microbacteriaceae bacterium]|nr:FadR family transcriptional regulator [Microbacteriaceae bacterium]